MRNCPPSRAARSSGQPLWPRRQSQERQSQDLFFCSSACFYVGVLCGGNPCEHGENMQTPHRKAREIAHLSTVHSYNVLLSTDPSDRHWKLHLLLQIPLSLYIHTL